MTDTAQHAGAEPWHGDVGGDPGPEQWALPKDEEAERAVLGAMMLSPAALAEVRPMLTGADFYRPAHEQIFNAITELADAGRPADPLVVAQALGGELQRIGGAPYLHTCMAAVPTTGSAGWWAQIVLEKAYARRVIEAGTRLVQIGRSAEIDDPLRTRVRTEYAALVETEKRGWDQPAPLGAAAAKLPEFPGQVLPKWLAMQVASVSEYTQTPMDLAGTVALSALSAACGGRAKVVVRKGEWTEPVNLYTISALPPGTRKTAVFNAMIRPLKKVEKDLVASARPRNAEQRAMRQIAEERAARTATAAAKASLADRAGAEADAREAARELAETPEPHDPQLMTDDVSPANLATLLAQNGGRFAILSDESEIFDIMAGRHTSGAPAMNVFLKGHAGSELKVNRTTRTSDMVDEPALTIGVCTQPVALSALAAIPGAAGRGLLARWLFTIPEVAIGYRNTKPAPADPAIGAEYDATMTSLILTMFQRTTAAELVLDAEAEKLLDAAGKDYEERMRDGEALSGIREWSGKAVGAAARIAGLLHLAEHLRDGWGKPINRATIEAALAIMDYYTAHALAAFDVMSTDETIVRARAVLDWIQRTGADRFTARDPFSSMSRSRFPKITDMDAALAVLERHGYIRRLPDAPAAGRGRPTAPTYEAHPDIGT